MHMLDKELFMLSIITNLGWNEMLYEFEKHYHILHIGQSHTRYFFEIEHGLLLNLFCNQH